MRQIGILLPGFSIKDLLIYELFTHCLPKQETNKR
nr:MAG TPA: hypothetical protein [Caudoviricetes sp.]